MLPFVAIPADTDAFISKMNVHVLMGPALSPRQASGTVMASIDGNDQERLIIADVDRDEAWIAMPMAEAPALSRWR